MLHATHADVDRPGPAQQGLRSGKLTAPLAADPYLPPVSRSWKFGSKPRSNIFTIFSTERC